jgi:hypothetical protein
MDIETGNKEEVQPKGGEIKKILTIFGTTFGVGLIFIIIAIIVGNLTVDPIVKIAVTITSTIIGFGMLVGSVIYLVLGRNWRGK